MQNIKVKFKTVNTGVTPSYATEGSAGADLYALDTFCINPGEIKLVSTGLYLEIPEGYEAQIRPRSSMAKKGVTVANSPATIDSDYRGEVKVMLINHHSEHLFINRGDRIAQMVFAPVAKADFERVDTLGDTQRGEGGFGSTGV